MHYHNLEKWQHSHNFVIEDQHQSEKKTLIVLGITFITMIAEIIAGTTFGSMALLADGWHMATHVGAFSITVLTYRYARINAYNPKYTFGTGKVTVLGGFASAIALSVIALITGIESIIRLFQPQEIQFNQAIYVAILGLIVNIASAFLLQEHHHHDHEHSHHHHDHNLQAAYFHVLADALTSVLAIIALLSAREWGWLWMDSVMGLVATLVIGKWAWGLIGETSTMLLDGTVNQKTKLEIANIIESDADNRIVDLHFWNISENYFSATISLVTYNPQPPEYYKNLLKNIPNLSHILIEVNLCDDENCQ
ncbi:MAG: CDF family Co(II)/Ni(II) efflux transporter DmeF [Cyanobacteria bacterium]|nr:CDF family Co(II)/Ni(II) efflux transporter DmeF [Cyanobacteria bacterium CG_2015-16_32_12]NCO78277.1 CDF family Co(II)/Ni(II) efflux transporter DmeF [Cyanobacteria bacterium CG_2015-22_32_23]NCQ02914.1 CDF family Co(II)/Ni(II) efflux transporter DmeF [Cyanobacteria bacterium CG_2015-09_32_10]NCQ41190.1 CDF family Co(II)/Ni(II) efflux transporter DmeF [Cyanobacteria bacterium CG_2015-04_32_10]NCS83503.1 CDF family Co(II)/Ni(II) efflux transporter DmeF [Cyanobacteria bacterium CG_2015-02_32_